MTGVINRNGVLAGNSTSGGYVGLVGGKDGTEHGGGLWLYDDEYTDYTYRFLLRAADSGTYTDLKGSPDGQLVWGSKSIVRSAVTTSGTADANGNLGQGVLFTG